MRIQGIQWDTVRSRGKQPEGIINEDTGDTVRYRWIQPQGIIHEDKGDTRGYSTLQGDTATGDNS